jgi:hypothetical protein
MLFGVLATLSCVTQPDPDIPQNRPERPVVSYETVRLAHPDEAGVGGGFETREQAIIGIPSLVRTVMNANLQAVNGRLQGTLVAMQMLRELEPIRQDSEDWVWQECGANQACSSDVDCCSGVCIDGMCAPTESSTEMQIASTAELSFSYLYGDFPEGSEFRELLVGSFEQALDDDASSSVRRGSGRLDLDLGAIEDAALSGRLRLAFRNDAERRRVNVHIGDYPLLGEEAFGSIFEYEQETSGGGSVSFLSRGGMGEELELVSVAAVWLGSGEGRGAMRMNLEGIGELYVEECWDAAGLTVWGSTSPMSIGIEGGSEQACAAALRSLRPVPEPRVEPSPGTPQIP